MKKFQFKKSLAVAILFAIVFCGVYGVSAKDQEKRIVIENDGWKLVGDLVVPKSKKKVPAVILLHKANGNRKIYEKMAKYLAEHKIASFRVDLRGHGESLNRGKFGPPFDAKMRSMIVGSDRDISAVFKYLTKHAKIDADRIGIVGASYSGEQMMISARKNSYAKAYVAISPGSFGEESIGTIDGSKASWLFITSAEEKFLQGFLSNVRRKSKTAQTLEVAGSKHATDIFESNPELPEMIAVWLKHYL